jgi:hypothetical protein
MMLLFTAPVILVSHIAGRISMAGVFSSRVKYLAEAIHEVTKNE